MKLKHITFTGIDAKTDLNLLEEIQKNYPIAEFGVLVSKKWRENGNRYFNPSYLPALKNRSLNLSAHLCGRIVRDAVIGNMESFKNWLNGNDSIFNRCQLNVSTMKNSPDEFIYCGEITKFFNEVILQQKSAERCKLFINSPKDYHVTTLLDASGGHGIDTEIVPLSIDHKVGYAGGITPDNVGEKLSFLMENNDVKDFWIDMESGVRTDDWFDVDKVIKVLETCDSIINKK